MEVEKRRPEEVLPRIRAIMEAGGSCRLLVTGGSMLPILRSEKDWVILAPCTQTPKRGDILFYVRPSGYCVLHRVHRVLDAERFAICGDAQTALEMVEQRQVVAKVSHIQRGERVISCEAPGWKLLSWFWMLTKPLRPLLMKGIGLLWRRKQRMKG